MLLRLLAVLSHCGCVGRLHVRLVRKLIELIVSLVGPPAPVFFSSFSILHMGAYSVRQPSRNIPPINYRANRAVNDRVFVNYHMTWTPTMAYSRRQPYHDPGSNYIIFRTLAVA